MASLMIIFTECIDSSLIYYIQLVTAEYIFIKMAESIRESMNIFIFLNWECCLPGMGKFVFVNVNWVTA
jgi:hypothetical protein